MPNPIKPTDRTLADMWASYAKAVIRPGTSAKAIRSNQFAFYGGASYVLDLLVAIGDDKVSLDTGIATLARLRQEMYGFITQQGARLKAGH